MVPPIIGKNLIEFNETFESLGANLTVYYIENKVHAKKKPIFFLKPLKIYPVFQGSKELVSDSELKL